MEMLLAWLERFNPVTRVLIIAVVPALLVFGLEEMTRPAQKTTTVYVEKKEPQIDHVFTSADADSIKGLANQSQSMLQALDENLSKPHVNPSEPICLNGLRYGVYAYINNLLTRLQDKINTSVNMQKAQDEQFVDDEAISTMETTINVLPAMENTALVMTKSCPGDALVEKWATPIRPMIGRITNSMRALAVEVKQHKQQQEQELQKQ